MGHGIVNLRDLSLDDVRELTRLLSRRPDYGIARPSCRWFSRQEEKIKGLPKPLLKPKGTISRLAFGLVARIDKNKKDSDKLLPPSAVLCHSHEPLNPFLIRYIFFSLTREVSGDYMSTLRGWPGKSPAVAAFLTRVDSIHAFWVSKEAFAAIFGAQPHDDRYVRVHNNCEACILSAIGANGRILADLHGWLTVRREDYKKYNKEAEARGSRKRKRTVPIYYLVDAWIKHLRPEDGVVVRRNAEAVATDLRQIWPAITTLKYDTLKRQKRGTRHELRTSKKGTAQLVEASGRAHGFGIPLPEADLEAAALSRNMAGLYRNLDTQSVYRADTVINGSGEQYTDEVIQEFRRRALRSLTSESSQRPRVPDQQHVDDDELYEKDATYQHEFDERDYEAEKESVVKVQRFFQSQAMRTTNTNIDQLDPESVHPAFQAERPMTSSSAVPSPLHLGNAGRAPSYQPDRTNWTNPPASTALARIEDTGHDPALQDNDDDAKSVWTDLSVYTTVDAFSVGVDPAPPMPQIPVEYHADYNDENRTATTTATPPVPSLTPDHGSSSPDDLASPSFRGTISAQEHSYGAFKPSNAPRPNAINSSTPRPPHMKVQRRKYLFDDNDSDVASHLTQTNKKYIWPQKGHTEEVSSKANPVVRQNSKRTAHTANRVDEQICPVDRRGTPRAGADTPQFPQGEGRTSQNREVDERARYQALNSINSVPPTPHTVPQDDAMSHIRNASETPQTESSDDIGPGDSASNLDWQKKSTSDMTQLAFFMRSQDRQ
ncbi:hypothetical protein BKA67DRAFT_658586 [Truncatella angustata]|uniref:Uncharacterized protein n=1 Tax=Truncatella angustata TaxID=152316 RepID=A0A9P8ULG1_9PEZI|nr:uncharacterized protein BKA67DRAFT_658586 [Truncatella angustata]KAH6654278.1 hypothetical protein BKA67DRAFT_658586 [Truncatella angustata]KAH8203422.1 hypothetical protein TruAng_002406 [Truncatella angustata]